MAFICENRLVIVGPKHSLARFKQEVWWRNPLGNEPHSFHMERLVPLENGTEEEADREWGCTCADNATIRCLDPGTWCGAVEINFCSRWDPPEKFVKKASALYPKLEFHHRYTREDPSGHTIRCYTPRVDCALGCYCFHDELEDYLREYQGRPWPDPWADGLFENPDTLKPNHNEDGSQ